MSSEKKNTKFDIVIVGGGPTGVIERFRQRLGGRQPGPVPVPDGFRR